MLTVEVDLSLPVEQQVADELGTWAFEIKAADQALDNTAVVYVDLPTVH